MEIDDMNDNNTPDPVQPQPTPIWVALVALIGTPVVIYFAWVLT
jgi:hypothetical protein